jgi:hypothetical protein
MNPNRQVCQKTMSPNAPAIMAAAGTDHMVGKPDSAVEQSIRIWSHPAGDFRPRNRSQTRENKGGRKMAKVSETYPQAGAEWYVAEDLKTGPLTVKVAGAETDNTLGEPAIVLTFMDQQKTLRLNKTNARSLAARFGDDTDGWLGKEFMMAAVDVEYQGKIVKGIRIL